jgi:23S rRNA (guanine2445-N2)-methyltransferase / 23S rRNA (guanine2069-N7)-methyltransferase
MRACLWSRLASRILLVMAEGSVEDADDLYDVVHAVAWEEHMSAEETLAVDAVGTTESLNHTGFTAQRAKDAIVDRLRERTGARPSVDVASPDVRVNVRLHKGEATISFDLAGEPLHRRGYRVQGDQAIAPLKENLAAAVLFRAGWPTVAANRGALLDPMCGSGTLLIEGALIASDQAPGLMRPVWGFEGLRGFDGDSWDELLDEADERAEAGRADMPRIQGRDADASVLETARKCIAQAGLGKVIEINHGELLGLGEAHTKGGLIVANPPYGQRMGGGDDLSALYSALGERMAEGFAGWTGAVLTSDPALARAVGLRSRKSYSLFNAAVPVKLYLFELGDDNAWRPVG